MTRIVRLEEIDGDLVLRVPADMAARLRLVAGDVVSLGYAGSALTVERFGENEEQQRQMQIGMQIMDEEHDVLAALAKS